MRVFDNFMLSRPFIRTQKKINTFWGAQLPRQGQSRFGHTFPGAEPDDSFFRYTSGRWLYDEHLQLKRRYTNFCIDALKEVAGQTLESRCVRITKLPEGLYNKVFSLEMENGTEILARVPNPNAGNAALVVSNELRNVLDVPVPEAIGWSSPRSHPNTVGAGYILMKRMQGRQLKDVWPTMPEAQRFGLVKNMVNVEAKLTNAKLSSYGGIYYRDSYPDDLSISSTVMPDGLCVDATAKYVIGPTTERSFWVDERQKMDIDRGPWKTAVEYLSAVAHREIACIRDSVCATHENTPLLPSRTTTAVERHVHLVQQYLDVLPHILPPSPTLYLVLMHHDLHPDNIFVDDSDHTKITGLIDWQSVCTNPLFLQARFPSVFDSDDPYPWGAVKPQLPDEFDSLSEQEKLEAQNRLTRVRLKKFYEMACRKFHSDPIKAMDAMREDDDPTNFIFHIVSQASVDGPVPLLELLVQIYEKWDQISDKRGLTIPCPISFTENEIKQARKSAQEWAEAYNQFDSLKTEIVGKDGWVPHEGFEEAMRNFEEHKHNLEMLRKRLNEAASRGWQRAFVS